MIVWLNGSFGVGKTTTAGILKARWPDTIVFDPELLGVGLRAWTPSDALVRDFQDIQLWRDLVVTTCTGLVAEWGRPLIVPMTVLRPAYFEEIFGRLEAADVDLRHFCLTAPTDVLRARVEQRANASPELAGLSDSQRQEMALWVEERWAEYDAFDERFAEHVDATDGDAEAVADRIVAALGPSTPARLPSSRWTEWAADQR